MYEYRLLFLKDFFVNIFYEIVYLLYVDNEIIVVIGKVIELYFGNWIDGIGIDVVFV